MIKDIATNLQSFQAKVTQFARTAPAAQVTVMQRRLALGALKRVVDKTPVDTGHARGNWQTTTVRAAEDQVDGIGRDSEKEGRPVINAAQPFGVIWISNNVPYIERLEDGYSKQAPAGMLALTLSELETQFG